MPIYPNLVKLMAQKGMGQAEMADYLSINVSTFNLKVNGNADFRKSEIDKIISFFGKNYE